MSQFKQTLLTGSLKKFLSATVTITILTTASTAAVANTSWNNEHKISSPQELLEWQERMSNASDEEREDLLSRDIKLQAMHNYAKTVAIRAAMSSRLNEMSRDVTKHSRQLDAIYNFSPLMIQQRVVPPVITEARNLYNQDGNLQIRLSDAIFNIEQQAYFSSTAPNWRTYLSFENRGNAYEKLSYVSGEMKPSNDIEEEIWIDGTTEGWRIGLEQANVVLQQAMDRLNRDYVGMVRFHEMVLQGKITMPSVSNYDLYDNNEGDRLILGEELLQIDVLPTFRDQRSLNRVQGSMPGSSQLSMAGASIETPPALDREPTKQVYSTVENIRNGQDITDQPWTDASPLEHSNNPLERPVYVNVNQTQVFRPKVVETENTGPQFTQEQLKNLELVEEPIPQEEPLRRYQDPLPDEKPQPVVTPNDTKKQSGTIPRGMFMQEDTSPTVSAVEKQERDLAQAKAARNAARNAAENAKKRNMNNVARPMFVKEDIAPKVVSQNKPQVSEQDETQVVTQQKLPTVHAKKPLRISQNITEGSSESLSVNIKRTGVASAAAGAFSYSNEQGAEQVALDVN